MRAYSEFQYVFGKFVSSLSERSRMRFFAFRSSVALRLGMSSAVVGIVGGGTYLWVSGMDFPKENTLRLCSNQAMMMEFLKK